MGPGNLERLLRRAALEVLSKTEKAGSANEFAALVKRIGAKEVIAVIGHKKGYVSSEAVGIVPKGSSCWVFFTEYRAKGPDGRKAAYTQTHCSSVLPNSEAPSRYAHTHESDRDRYMNECFIGTANVMGVLEDANLCVRVQYDNIAYNEVRFAQRVRLAHHFGGVKTQTAQD